MKITFTKLLSFLLFSSLIGCQGPAIKENQPTGNSTQKLELEVDGSIKTADPTPILTASFTNSHLMLSYLSDKDDIQFGISAYMQDLQTGSYQVYDCKAASECQENEPDNNQMALYAPYPRNPMPPINLSRTAYTSARLGLRPLTLIITSIKDEQQAGNPLKTKRIEGQFNGTLAYAEQEKGGYEYHVVASSKINGKFSLLCNMQ